LLLLLLVLVCFLGVRNRIGGLFIGSGSPESILIIFNYLFIAVRFALFLSHLLLLLLFLLLLALSHLLVLWKW